MAGERQRGLGRGLGALIPTDVPREALAGGGRPVDLFFEGTKGKRSAARGKKPATDDNEPTVNDADLDTLQPPTAPTPDGPSVRASARRAHNGNSFDKAFEGLIRKDRGDSRPDPRARGDKPERTAGAEAEVKSAQSGRGDGVVTTGQGENDGAKSTTKRGDPPPQSRKADALSGADRATGPHDGLQPVPGLELIALPLDQIQPNARQPREVFDEQELEELVASIREIGVLQPIVVRRVEGQEKPYELIMGERRWRASGQAGLDAIPALVKSTRDDDMLRDALLENLHRAQLNPLEEASAYQQLLDDFGCTHEELATRVARSRPQISNTLRLLKLPPTVARRVAAGVLSAGHARALLGLDDAAAMERMAQRIVAEGLSVRSVEEIVAVSATPDTATGTRRPRVSKAHPEYEAIASRMTDRLDTRVSISMGRRKGKLTVEFAGREDLERILSALHSGEAYENLLHELGGAGD